MKNIVILLSGRGSNFVSIVKEAERAGWAKEGLKIACVVSNRPGAAGLERAKESSASTLSAWTIRPMKPVRLLKMP